MTSRVAAWCRAREGSTKSANAAPTRVESHVTVCVLGHRFGHILAVACQHTLPCTDGLMGGRGDPNANSGQKGTRRRPVSTARATSARYGTTCPSRILAAAPR
jgi:hypothetical protein